MPDQRIVDVRHLVPDTYVDPNSLMGLTGEDALRGLGHTTHQMKTAPYKATFIWCTADIHYPRDLARFLMRDDLNIVSAHAAKYDHNRFRGHRYVVVDHAFGEHHPHTHIREYAPIPQLPNYPVGPEWENQTLMQRIKEYEDAKGR